MPLQLIAPTSGTTHTSHLHNLALFLTQQNLGSLGLAYQLVTIFGSQSTGKSTLLNGIFGTEFNTMDETITRQQTTQGIWIEKAKKSNTLVIDVEGTDGRERGECQDFERRSALFSLAVSGVILINMWENMVGLYNGANMGLLKTVFEVNLQLFQTPESPKTLLMFVIRDHVGRTPMEKLRETLIADMTKIWSEISRPAHMLEAQISDFFDFEFATLPHKIYSPDAFGVEIDKLQTRFNDSTAPDYIFKPKYFKQIPIDGLPRYTEAVWEKIVSNKDLDLPSQQVLLAQYRCDEISVEAYEPFVRTLQSFKKHTDHGVWDDLGSSMREARKTALDLFSQSASRYNTDVYTKKKAELSLKLDHALLGLFEAQIRALLEEYKADFGENLKAKLDEPNSNYNTVSAELKNTTMDNFKLTSCVSDVMIEDANWSIEPYQQTLKKYLDSTATAVRSELVESTLLHLETSVKNHMLEPVVLALSNANEDVWDKIGQTYQSATQNAMTILKSRSEELTFTPTELEEKQKHVSSQSFEALIAIIKTELSDEMTLTKLRRRFEDIFRYDEEGLPRVWKPQDDIDSAFTKARTEAHNLLELLKDVKSDKIPVIPRHDEPDVIHDETDSPLLVFSASKVAAIRERFKRDADTTYLEAKRSVVATQSKLPTWVIVLLVVLGWNEFITILTNPIYIVGIIMLLGTSYTLYTLNLWGPVLTIGKTISKELLGQAHEAVNKMKEAGQEHSSPRKAQRDIPLEPLKVD